MINIDELMHGAIDLHCHHYPEISLDLRTRLTDIDCLRMAESYGMKAIVLKSHMWPTMSHTYLLQEQLSDINVFGGIALNPCVGGVKAWVVEAAIKLGARAIWMPTWGAKNDNRIEWGEGASKILKKAYNRMNKFPSSELISIIDDKGSLREEVKDILQIIKDAGNVVLFTGHISPSETLALAKAAAEEGFKKLVFSHPLSSTVGAKIEDMLAVAKMGFLIEFCFIATLPLRQKESPQEIYEAIKQIGSDHCILSTDAIYAWGPPEPEMFRMFIAAMLELGLNREQIRVMVQENPEKLLGIQ